QWKGHEVHWSDYARMQWWAVARYVRLSVWPSPLVFAYGKDVGETMGQVLPSALVVLGLLVGTVVGLVKRHWAGYLGAWFFLILAPTSSVGALSGQVVAEHRMYLPLAGITVLVVVGAYAGWQWTKSRHPWIPVAA